MTLEEVAEELGKCKKTIYYNLARTQKNLAKKGIILSKWGWGKNAEYEIEYEDVEEEE